MLIRHRDYPQPVSPRSFPLPPPTPARKVEGLKSALRAPVFQGPGVFDQKPHRSTNACPMPRWLSLVTFRR